MSNMKCDKHDVKMVKGPLYENQYWGDARFPDKCLILKVRRMDKVLYKCPVKYCRSKFVCNGILDILKVEVVESDKTCK